MNPGRVRRRLLETTAGRAALTAMSWGYGAAVWVRGELYRRGALRSARLPVRTVCIGNLTAGGAGKTTAVMLAARTLAGRKFKTAILSRGYRRPEGTREVVTLVDGRPAPSWRRTGDEPWMMHQSLKGLDIPILVCPDRVKAGQAAHAEHRPDVILLDDGFQHFKLRRDLDIVLVDAMDPFGEGALLPRGTLREPFEALARAGLVLITHADKVPAERLKQVREAVKRANPAAPVAEASHRPDFLFDLKREEKLPLERLGGLPVAAFSGIGRPESFRETLEGLGAKVEQEWRFPDHHPYSAADVRAFQNVRRGLPLVTTFKDIPRLPQGWRHVLEGEVFAVGVSLHLTKGKGAWEAALCGTAAGD